MKFEKPNYTLDLLKAFYDNYVEVSEESRHQLTAEILKIVGDVPHIDQRIHLFVTVYRKAITDFAKENTATIAGAKALRFIDGGGLEAQVSILDMRWDTLNKRIEKAQADLYRMAHGRPYSGKTHAEDFLFDCVNAVAGNPFPEKSDEFIEDAMASLNTFAKDALRSHYVEVTKRATL